MTRRTAALLPASLLLSALLTLPGCASTPADDDPVVMRFATVGDSREEPSDQLNAQDRLWLQNTRVWSRIMREVQAQQARALFFNGDMIMGYTTQVPELNRQYAYWRGMVTQLQETGTYVVPVPGNHEVQEKFKENGQTRKLARAGNEAAWRANMGDLIMDPQRWQAALGSPFSAFDRAHAPPIGGADPVTTDQSQLSYSFDFGPAHFAIINTDAVGWDTHAPVAWLQADLAAARARGAQRLFVFGHKPAFTYHFKPGSEKEGLDNFPAHQQAFWQLIEDAGATYFCGHEHIYHLMQPWAAQGGRAWQVMVGSGGSPFSAAPGESANPEDRLYAWAIVTLRRSGQVELDTYGFDEHLGPTRQLRHLAL